MPLYNTLKFDIIYMVMFSVYKYKFLEDLQVRHKNTFKMCQGDSIEILPPILKKVGVFYHLAFLVIDYNSKNPSKSIKRPIGIILLNKNGKGKEKVFDMSQFEFCKKEINYNKEFYSLTSSPSYWPNKNEKNIEFLRMCLQDLLKISKNCNMFKKPDKVDYQNYLARVSKLFPANYWIFFEALEQNEIEQISSYDLKKRKQEEYNYAEQLKLNRLKVVEQNKIKQNSFYKKLIEDISLFCKKEIIPNLLGKGSFSKLKFYQLFGAQLRKIKYNLQDYLNCYNIELSQSELDKNYESQLNKLKVKIIKIYSKASDNNFGNNITIDTLSKVLIIYLNALLIEDIHKKLIKIFEDEIKECVEIFESDINKISNTEVKDFLTNIYTNLQKDYYEIDEDKYSDCFIAYLKINGTKPQLLPQKIKD